MFATCNKMALCLCLGAMLMMLADRPWAVIFLASFSMLCSILALLSRPAAGGPLRSYHAQVLAETVNRNP